MGHYSLYILFTYSFPLIHMNLPPYVLRCAEKNLTAPHLIFTVLTPDWIRLHFLSHSIIWLYDLGQITLSFLPLQSGSPLGLQVISYYSIFKRMICNYRLYNYDNKTFFYYFYIGDGVKQKKVSVGNTLRLKIFLAVSQTSLI